MTRFVALVEFQDGGGYWISFPGLDKTYRLAKTPGDIIPQARAFLDEQATPVALPPALDDALTDPREPFEGAKLVMFDWEPR